MYAISALINYSWQFDFSKQQLEPLY